MVALSSQPLFPIGQLSPYHRSWVIKARVTSIGAPRTFQRKGGGGEGKLFSVELLDAEGSQIRATFFNEAVDMYGKVLENGKVFFLSGGNLRVADARYKTNNHRYEINFDRGCNIEKASDDDKTIQTVRFEFVDLRTVQSKPLPCIVDLCGVVQSAAEVVKLTAKSGNELIKRDVLIADDTGYTLNVTLWGEEAQRKDSDFQGNPVLAAKCIRINDFNERSGSTISNSMIKLNPENVEEVKRLSDWWSNGGSKQELKALSQQRAVGGGGAAADRELVDLADARERFEKAGDKTEFFSTVARVQQVQLRRQGEKVQLYYTACAEPKMAGSTLTCNRKVMEDGQCPVCMKPGGKTSVRLMTRLQFADASDTMWMGCFDNSAQVLLGATGEEVRAADKEGDKLEGMFASKMNMAPFKLTLRCRAEEYQGERRPKLDCVDARPVSFKEHGAFMLKEVMNMVAVN
jgi:replication factor A1